MNWLKSWLERGISLTFIFGLSSGCKVCGLSKTAHKQMTHPYQEAQ